MENNLNPATAALLQALAAVGDKVDGVRDTLQRRESQSPGLFPLGAIAYTTSIRFRVESFVIAVSAAGQYSLRVGSANVFTVETAAADTLVIPLPITIDSGVDISVVGAGLTGAFIVAYTDHSEGEI